MSRYFVIALLFLPLLMPIAYADLAFPGGETADAGQKIDQWYINGKTILGSIIGAVALIAAIVASVPFFKGDSASGWDKVQNVAIGCVIAALLGEVIIFVFI